MHPSTPSALCKVAVGSLLALLAACSTTVEANEPDEPGKEGGTTDGPGTSEGGGLTDGAADTSKKDGGGGGSAGRKPKDDGGESGGGGKSGTGGKGGTGGTDEDAGPDASDGGPTEDGSAGMGGYAGDDSGPTCTENLACQTAKEGVCKPGKTVCTSGVQSCNQNVLEDDEICDGLDNDCNGLEDDNVTDDGSTCDTGLDGICAAGHEVCQGGGLVCVQDASSDVEVCNGLDDDCNGTPDDGTGGAACPMIGLLGECANGIFQCTGGGGADAGADGGGDGGTPDLVCTQVNFVVDETCNNLDDDCDGTPDNNDAVGVFCNTGLHGICDNGHTTCSSGTPGCLEDTTVGTKLERCNNLNDNCDVTDLVDEDADLAMCQRNCDDVGGGTIPGTVTVNCNGAGACVTSSCPAGTYDANQNVCDGCEASSCASFVKVGNAASITTIPTACNSGNIPTASAALPTNNPITGLLTSINDVAFFKVDFSDQANPGYSNNKPKIQLTAGATDYRIDVYQSCAAGVPTIASCPVGSGSGAASSGSDLGPAGWSMDFDGLVGRPGTGVGNRYCQLHPIDNGKCTNPDFAVPTMWVKITRKAITATAGSCGCANPECVLGFTVTISEGP